MYNDKALGNVTSTLFTKVSVLLTGSMLVAALGAYLGAGITGFGAFIVLMLLFIGGSIGVAIAAETAPPTVAVPLMFGWTFVTGLFLGPCMNMYVQVLGGNTVMLAFLGTGGVMAVCGAIGVLSGVNFSGLGKFLTFALLGLIIVGIVNIFVAFSTGVEIAYCLIGMAIFAGFFIVDFFRLKEQAGRGDTSWSSAIHVSMALFLDFINFFLFLLRLLAASRGGSSKK